MEYYQQELPRVFTELQSSETGLRSQEARGRLGEYGINKIGTEKKLSALRLLLAQFNDPLVWILLFAFIVSLFIQHFIDASVILVVLVFDACFGFFQEYKAEKAILHLQKLRQYHSHVLREGKDVLIDSKELVPGDVLFIEEGDKIPADCRLFAVSELKVDEASLTGESHPVKKIAASLHREFPLADRSNMVFAGTSVVSGRGRAVVVATGAGTELGRIARALEFIEEEATPLQKKLKEVGKWITLIIVGISILVFFLGLLYGFGVAEMFLVAVSLAVAAVPEGLPAVVTITLALGLRRMLKRKALIRKLRSVETLGSVTVICSDKTGTLTKNEMMVTRIFAHFREYEVSGSGYSLHGDILFQKKKVVHELDALFRIAASCNNATITLGDPTERALQVLAAKGKVKARQRVSEIPFSSDAKFMSVTDSEGVVYMKGALEVVLSKCSLLLVDGRVRALRSQDKKIISAKNEAFSREALRVLAFAYGKGKHLIFVGIAGMIDPPREGVSDAIALCEKAGIRSIMITGDHAATALAVAQQVGISSEVLTGVDLEKMSDAALKRLVPKVSIYARVNSLHKVRILQALQARGEVVAMTGDGVNDAPALKQAHVGVAMNIKGTEIAKDVSDLILLDDHFATIVAAVEEGRVIYANIKKFITYLLAANFGEVALVVFSLLFALPLPLLPVQILWVNLVTDSFPALALGLDPVDPALMHRKPRKPHESFFRNTKSFMFFSTLFSVCLTLGLFLWYVRDGDVAKARSVIFTALILFELFLVFACRSEDDSLLRLKSNWYLYGAVALSLGLHLFLLYGPFASSFSLVPLSLGDWLLIVPLASSALVFFELRKLFVKVI